MDLIFDTDSDTLHIAAIGNATAEDIKALGYVDCRLQFLKGASAIRRAAGAPISLAIRDKEVDGTLLASCATWTRPDTDAGWYEGVLSLNTVAIEELLDGSATQKTFSVFAEARWSPPDLDPEQWRISSTVPMTLVRAVNDGSEAAPDAESDPSVFLRYDQAQTLTSAQMMRVLNSLGVTITAAGYLQLTASDGGNFHLALNSGAAPG